jgi:hypothetical protein
MPFQLTLVGLAAMTSAAPSPTNNPLQTHQECPYESYAYCVSTLYSECVSSGLEICQATGCGGPCYECDTFCKAKAFGECPELGCVKPNSE